MPYCGHLNVRNAELQSDENEALDADLSGSFLVSKEEKKDERSAVQTHICPNQKAASAIPMYVNLMIHSAVFTLLAS